ncbi:MAG: hypothetical protein ACN6QC_32490, partial [Paraburkholderia hospita]
FACVFAGIRVMVFAVQASPLCGAAPEARRQYADASAKTSKPNRPRHDDKTQMPAQNTSKPNRPRHEDKTRMQRKGQNNQNARAAQPQEQKKPNYDPDLTSGSANIDNPCTISRNICVT